MKLITVLRYSKDAGLRIGVFVFFKALLLDNEEGATSEKGGLESSRRDLSFDVSFRHPLGCGARKLRKTSTPLCRDPHPYGIPYTPGPIVQRKFSIAP